MAQDLQHVKHRLLGLRTHPLDCLECAEYVCSFFEFVLDSKDITDPMDQYAPTVVAEPAELVHQCITCEKVVARFWDLKRHRALKHVRHSATTRRMAMLCYSNACPWCSFCCSTTKILRTHIRVRDELARCPRSSNGSRTPFVGLASFVCPHCALRVRDPAALHAHVLQFVEMSICGGGDVTTRIIEVRTEKQPRYTYGH